MAVTSSLNKQTYVGNGTTKEFDFTFRVLSEGHIKLYLTNIGTEAVSEITSNYEVAPTGGSFPADSGTVTYPVSGSALTSGYKITLYREVPLLQETEYPNNTALKPKVVETDLDRITMMVQQNAEAIARSVQLPVTSDESGEDILTEIYNVKAETQGYADNAASSAASAASSETNAANSAASAAASATSADWQNGGTITGNLTVTGSITGNVATATKLFTARSINEVAFDGTTDIKIPIPTVRQTVYAGSVDSNGMPNYISVGTGLSVNVAATTTPIKMIAAGGDPANDRIGTISADTTISGLVGSKTISSITYSGTTATLTTATAHGLVTGSEVTISGATSTVYNGTYKITVTSSTTFTYTMASSPGANATVVGSYLVVNFLYADIALNGTVTLGSGLLQPIYQQGGTPVATNGQMTFNVGEMKEYVGNGSTYSQSYRIYIGESSCSTSSVSAAYTYALNGMFIGAWTNPLPSTNTNFSQNNFIGNYEYNAFVEIKCLTADAGYSVNDVIFLLSTGNASSGETIIPMVKNRLTVSATTSSTTPIIIINKTSGALVGATAANWAYRFICKRRF